MIVTREKMKTYPHTKRSNIAHAEANRRTFEKLGMIRNRWNQHGKGGLSGVLFTFGIAWLGYELARIPGFDRVGQMACAILLAVMYRQLFGYPEALRSGIVFSSQRLLRIAIVLYGLKLNMGLVLSEGVGLLVKDALVIAFAMIATLGLAKVFKADRNLSLLLGIGTGICGAAAVAALAPIVRAKEEDTAAAVGMIALLGTVFSVGYALLFPLLPLSSLQYGMWAGLSLHEVAHVALAGAAAGTDGLAAALLAKLGRVFLLLPVCLIFIVLMKKKERKSAAAPSGNSRTPFAFPWFLVGFLLMSMLGSYVLGPIVPVSDGLFEGIGALTTWLLTAAMAGLGLNVNLKDLRSRAFRPLLVMLTVSTLLSFLTLGMIL